MGSHESSEDEYHVIEPASDADILRQLMDVRRVSMIQSRRNTGLPWSTNSEVLAGMMSFSGTMIHVVSNVPRSCGCPDGELLRSWRTYFRQSLGRPDVSHWIAFQNLDRSPCNCRIRRRLPRPAGASPDFKRTLNPLMLPLDRFQNHPLAGSLFSEYELRTSG